MILVDKSIKERSGEIFCEGYAEKYVNAISYDLHIKGVICDDALKDSYTLHPGEFIGRIGEKNSRIRQGLSVAGPHYYPGHKTYIYLRIQNITCANITIRENDSIAQIIFEQLESVPEKAYDEQEDDCLRRPGRGTWFFFGTGNSRKHSGRKRKSYIC